MARNTNDSDRSLSAGLITLASASPRRRELLSLTGWKAQTFPAFVDEQPREGESASELALRLALAKAIQVAAKVTRKSLVLAADTVVGAQGQILGKPSTKQEAEQMLMALRGKDHIVVTALVLEVAAELERRTDICETLVPMRAYGTDELHAYIESDKPYDKAGAYGIQDDGFHPVDLSRMQGCYANVMGLPLCHLVRMMRALGHAAPVDVPVACQEHTGYTCPVFSDILREAE